MPESCTPPDEQLVAAATEALQRAYAPYSGFRVGAALAGASGRVFCGSNIETAVSGVSLCAERVALAKAVSEGERELRRLVLVGEDEEPVTPCGICRQTLWEFSRGLTVLMVGRSRRLEASLEELMPLPFSRRNRA